MSFISTLTKYSQETTANFPSYATAPAQYIDGLIVKVKSGGVSRQLWSKSLAHAVKTLAEAEQDAVASGTCPTSEDPRKTLGESHNA